MDNIVETQEKVFNRDQVLIYDSSNPALVRKEDGSVYMVMPASYPISQDEYNKLINGGQVEVTHHDGIWDGQQIHRGPDEKRIYGGPSQVAPV